MNNTIRSAAYSLAVDENVLLDSLEGMQEASKKGTEAHHYYKAYVAARNELLELRKENTRLNHVIDKCFFAFSDIKTFIDPMFNANKGDTISVPIEVAKDAYLTLEEARRAATDSLVTNRRQ